MRPATRASMLILGLACLAPIAARGESEPWSLSAEIGVGFDSNPTLAPKDPYFDQRNLVQVDPDEQGSLFVPVLLRGQHLRPWGNRRVVTEFRLRGDFFGDSEARNADELFARFAPGLAWVVGKRGRRENTVRATPFVSYKKEVYFDRDTGDDFLAGAFDVSDRYTYLSYGAELTYERRTGKRTELAFGARLEERDFEDVTGVSSLDHQRYRVDAEIEIELRGRSNLYFDYRYSVLDYDERPSRSLDGAARTSNPAREYSYHALGATLRARPADRWTLYLDYELRLREDDFQGYHDYTQNLFGVRLLFRQERWRVRVAAKFRQRDHDDAFIFDLPTDPVSGATNPGLTYDILQLDLRLERQLRGSFSAVFEANFRDEDSEDPRYAYVRNSISAGVRWRPRSSRL